MKKTSFTDDQIRILSWIVVALSILVVLEGAWLVYLKFEKATTEVKVVEIRGTFKVPEDKARENEVEVRQIELVKFDYERLITESATVLSKSSPVYVFTLSPEDSLKAIGMCGGPFLITRVSTDVYSLLFTKECTPVSVLAQREAYGVYFLATRDLGFAYAKMLDLRDITLPAYVVAYTKEGSPMYSVAIGAFPTRGSAKDFFESVDWNEIERETGVYEEEYVACVLGCD